MPKKYAASDSSDEAFRAREDERQEYLRAGTQPPAALLAQLSRDADAAMARAIARYGRD